MLCAEMMINHRVPKTHLPEGVGVICFGTIRQRTNQFDQFHLVVERFDQLDILHIIIHKRGIVLDVECGQRPILCVGEFALPEFHVCDVVKTITLLLREGELAIEFQIVERGHATDIHGELFAPVEHHLAFRQMRIRRQRTRGWRIDYPLDAPNQIRNVIQLHVPSRDDIGIVGAPVLNKSFE